MGWQVFFFSFVVALVRLILGSRKVLFVYGLGIILFWFGSFDSVLSPSLSLGQSSLSGNLGPPCGQRGL